MTLQPVAIQDFSGLDLVSDPPESGAIDLVNVDLDQRGRVRTRDGVQSFASPAAGAPAALFQRGSLLYLIRGGQLDSITTLGAVTNIGAVNTLPSVASLGTPTSSLLFIADGNGGNLVKKWDGTTLANSVGKPRYVAVSSTDNRLVQANFAAAADSPSGANGSTSTVFFSDPGAPETYSANNFVHLRPGDGETITAVVAWRELVFVFKQSVMFVFYGTSTTGTGTPIFNYRTVTLPQYFAGAGSVVAGADGVYFQAADGIYRTAGDVPSRISNVITPLFVDPSLAPTGTMQLSWAASRLFAAYTGQDGYHRLLVWDATYDFWTIWMIERGLAWLPPVAFNSSALFSARDGAVGVFQTSTTDDLGVPIEASYQSGWLDLGTPDDKRIQRCALWGSGSPTLSVFSDRASSDAEAAAVTLGTAPAVARTEQNKERRGRQLSWKLSSTSGAWSVSSVELYMADKRGTR